MATGTRLMQEISDQFLNCKICFESFREPKTLTCLHTFCLDCLQQQYEQEVSSRSSRFTIYTSRSVTCPLCRKKTELPAGGVRRLPDNFLVCNLNQVLAKRTVSRVPPCDICASVRGKSVDACSKCLDCTKLLCKACVDLHLSTKVTQQHSLIDLEGEKDIVCKVHNEETVKFYCEPCGACICVVCAFQEHRDHDVLSFSDGYAKYRGDLETLLDKCKSRADEVTSRLSAIDKYETVVKDVRDRIRDLAISSIAKVRAKERELLKRVDNVYGGEVQTFVESRPVLQENLDDLQSTCQLTDIMLKDKGVELLLIKRDIEGKMEQLLEKKLDPEVPFDATVCNIRFVPGDVVFGKLSFGGGMDDVEAEEDEDDDIGKLKKKEKNQMKKREEMMGNSDENNSDSSSSKVDSSQNEPDVITNCTQTEKCRTKETSTSMRSSMTTEDFQLQDKTINGDSTHTGRSSRYGNVNSTDDTDSVYTTNGSSSVCRDTDSRRTSNSVGGNGHSDFSLTSEITAGTSAAARAQRRAEREAARAAASGGGSRSDRAPAPDLVPLSSSSVAGSSSISSGAYVYTPGRTIRSRKIQTEISALDVEAGASNTDREFVQTMLHAEMAAAEKLRLEKEYATSRLRDRHRRVRAAEMGVMTSHQVRVVPEMTDKETSSESIMRRDAAIQALSEVTTTVTQTPVVRLENAAMCTDREGQAEKGTATQSIDVTDKETCTPVVKNEAKGTWTDLVATSDRATATMAVKLQHRAIGTVPPSTGNRACQISPQVSAMFTNTPVITSADYECQATPATSNTATMPDMDIEAKYAKVTEQTANASNTDVSADFLTPPQSPPPGPVAVITCDRASDAVHVPTSNKSTETPTVKTTTSSTETPSVKLVDRDAATTEIKTLDQWTETYSPTMINTGVTPPRPDTLEVGVATNVVVTDEQATCTDIKSFRDTQTETIVVLCDGETLTDPVGHSDAQTSVETHSESRHCETDTQETADETSMTDYYNPWEAVDTASQASQCDTAILKTKETNTAQLKRKAKEAQTVADPSLCPECGGNLDKDGAAPRQAPPAENGVVVSDLQSSKAFRDSSTMPQQQVTQDVGTMAISCTACQHEYQETAIQTFQPLLYDKSSATSFDLHEHFLARTLSREYHDVATSTDSLPIIGLLSENNVDELIVVPVSAPGLVSASGDAGPPCERVIMVDDETSTEFPQSVETGTQTLDRPAISDSDDADRGANAGESTDVTTIVESSKTKTTAGKLGEKFQSITESTGSGKNVGQVIQSLVETERRSLSGDVDNPEVTRLNVADSKMRCNNQNCPFYQDKHLVSIGINTAPKLTFEQGTSAPTESRTAVLKMDKGTSTLDQARIVEGRSPGMGRKTKSVDKITMTSRVEQKEVGVETDAQQIDGKITQCISKLRSVSERLNSPTATTPLAKDAATNNTSGSESVFGKAFGTVKNENENSGEQTNSPASITSEGPELERQKHVKNLLEQTKAILKRKDLSPVRKPQPITTLKGKKPLSPSERNEPTTTLSASQATESEEESRDVLTAEPGSSYNSKSLPRGFTSERRCGTVKMGSQPLSPSRLPLHRYNSAPGRIATVPAQTLLNKSGGTATVAKLGRSSSPGKLAITKKNSPTEPGNTSNSVTATPTARPKIIETSKVVSPHNSAVPDAGLSKPQMRHPLPSITETRTPSSCSDNSTASLHSSGSGASKRQSTGSAGGPKAPSPALQKRLPNEPSVAQTSPLAAREHGKAVSPHVPKSPAVTPKRLAGVALGAPNLLETGLKNTRSTVKSPSPRRKPEAADGLTHPLPAATPKRVPVKDPLPTSTTSRPSGPVGAHPTTLDPNRLSSLTIASSNPSRSPSSSTTLSVNMSDSTTSDTLAVASSRKSPKRNAKSSPSKEKIKTSVSSETLQSTTSTDTTDSTKSKKSGGISFMQRFLSKRKKSSDCKKEPVTVSKKASKPTVETAAAMSTLPTPVPAAPKESYAIVPLQHPPHHYIPQPEVKTQAPVHKPSAFVYVQQRLISIQQDNVEDKRSRDAKRKSDDGQVAHKHVVVDNKESDKDKDVAKKPEKVALAPKGASRDASKDPSQRKEKSKPSDVKPRADLEKTGVKKEEKDRLQAEKGKVEAKKVQKTETASVLSEKGEKEGAKSKPAETKTKKSEVKSSSSWIRGKGEKFSKK